MSRYFALRQSNHPKMGAWAHIFQMQRFIGDRLIVLCVGDKTLGVTRCGLSGRLIHTNLYCTQVRSRWVCWPHSSTKIILDLKGKIQIEDFLSHKARGRDEGDLRWISQDGDQVDGNGFAVCGINKRTLSLQSRCFFEFLRNDEWKGNVSCKVISSNQCAWLLPRLVFFLYDKC